MLSVFDPYLCFCYFYYKPKPWNFDCTEYNQTFIFNEHIKKLNLKMGENGTDININGEYIHAIPDFDLFQIKKELIVSILLLHFIIYIRTRS